jgi:aminoglycoside phosphotransferase (APT) family kinase protein
VNCFIIADAAAREARHMSKLDRLVDYVKETGPALLFPRNAKDVNVRNLCPLKIQGADSRMYSFHITYFLEGKKHQTALLLRSYSASARVAAEIGRKEFAVLKALKEQKISVPTAYLLETRKEILGKTIMIIEQIVGKSASNFFHDETAALLTVDKLAKSLAMVHKLDPSCISYPGLLREQQSFAQGQLAFARHFIKHKCHTSFPPNRGTRYLEALERLKKMPISQRFCPTLLHMDFTPDHVLMAKKGPVIIDWADATVGDPAYEVARTYHILMWVGRSQIDHKIIEKPTIVGVDLREHFVRCYEKYTGHKLANLEFYKNFTALMFVLYFDGRLRPGIISRPIIPLGLKGRLFGAFFVRNEMRPFFDYCVQYLESKGILL